MRSPIRIQTHYSKIIADVNRKPLDAVFHLCNYLSMHNPLAQIAVFALVAAIAFGVKYRKKKEK